MALFCDESTFHRHPAAYSAVWLRLAHL